MVGLEGGRQPSTASWIAVSSAVAAASRCLRMDALRGMRVREKWWSVDIPRVIVSVRASSLQDSREALQVRSRALVAFVRADIWRSLCSFLLYVYCSDGGMQTSRAG